MRGVKKRFGSTQALDGVDLEIESGEIHALVGENGAGKSTLMKILAGATPPDEGSIELFGAPYVPNSPGAARQSGVAMIFQELTLAPHLSVAENILLGDEPGRFFVDRSAARARAKKALEEIGRADIPLDARVASLPAAERQLIEIARAVALDARVLVLDEPTSSLGREDAAEVFALLKRLRERGLAIIYISHFLDEIFALADRFTVLRDGATVAKGRMKETSPEKMVAAMVGREVEDLYPRTPAVAGPTIGRIDRLCGEKFPIEANLEIRRGEVLGIAGLVGSGRSEFLRAVFGLDAVKSGAVDLLAYRGGDPEEAWKCGVGFLSEDRKIEGLMLERSIAENIDLPLLSRQFGFFLRDATIEKHAKNFAETLGVKCASMRQNVGALSGGNQQKVALARLAAAGADLLLLDEPTRGIDVGAKAEIYRMIDRWAHDPATPPERRRAVVLVSSYLPELLGTADRIAVMCRGRLGPARRIEEVDERSLMLEAAGGKS